MERYPQLSPPAQNELAATFQAGIAAKAELAKATKLSAREERRLQELVRKGDRAIEYLVASNFRLVMLICRERAEGRWGRERANEALPDLVGYANIALLDAARSFSPTEGPSFPTYAATKIRHSITAIVNRDHPVKVPPSWSRLKRLVAVHTPELAAKLGRQPQRQELVDYLLEVCMAWAYDHLNAAEKALPEEERKKRQMDRLRKQGMLGALENLDEVLIQTQSPTMLDAPLREDGGTIGDSLASPEGNMTAKLEAEEMSEAVAKLLAGLPEREREIIRYRYGFVDGESWPYQKISQLYGVSAERIRQIERAAIARLGLPGIGAHLADFLGHQVDED